MDCNFLGTFLPLVVAILAWGLNERSKKKERELNKKEKIYEELLVSIGKIFTAENPKSKKEELEKLIENWLRSYTCCPPEIIKAIENFFESQKKDDCLKALVQEIRKDLELKEKLMDKVYKF